MKHIETHESRLKHDLSIMSMTTPNDGLRYDLTLTPIAGTMTWQWSPTGHTITCYDYASTFDKIGTYPVSWHKRLMYAYGYAMLVHEAKGHGALSTRELVAMGDWCADNGVHPELLNIAEDCRVESALSQKRPGDTKSKGEWIDHEGTQVFVPTKSAGGDYGWRKAGWHKFNAQPNCTNAPTNLLNALVWAERTRKLEKGIADEFYALTVTSGTPLDVATWGKGTPKALFNWVHRWFLQCRKWKKYRTTESLKPLLTSWVRKFPEPPPQMQLENRTDVVINMLMGGAALRAPSGDPITLEDAFPLELSIPPQILEDMTPEGAETPEPTPEPKEKPKMKKPTKESGEDEPERPPEELKQHDKTSEASDGERGDKKHDAQTADIGDGGSSELTHETHTVDPSKAPTTLDLPAWVGDFAKRDSDFGSSNEKLPADFF